MYNAIIRKIIINLFTLNKWMHVYSYIIYNYMHVHVRNCACDIIIIVYGEYYIYII